MSSIGTFEDFRKFAVSNTKANGDVLDGQVKNFVYPTIVEERSSNIRANEMNVFSRLVQDRIIFLSGEVSSESMDTITAQLLYLDSIDNREINIYINSVGGDCYSGLELVSVMNFVKSDVSTTVLGLAASMGAVISSSGAKGKRFLLPYSRFMIHQPSSSSGYFVKFTDSKVALREMESVREDLYHILADNSGKPFDEIVELCENGDKWFKGEEAVENGFADSVIRR